MPRFKISRVAVSARRRRQAPRHIAMENSRPPPKRATGAFSFHAERRVEERHFERRQRALFFANFPLNSSAISGNSASPRPVTDRAASFRFFSVSRTVSPVICVAPPPRQIRGPHWQVLWRKARSQAGHAALGRTERRTSSARQLLAQAFLIMLFFHQRSALNKLSVWFCQYFHYTVSGQQKNP